MMQVMVDREVLAQMFRHWSRQLVAVAILLGGRDADTWAIGMLQALNNNDLPSVVTRLRMGGMTFRLRAGTMTAFTMLATFHQEHIADVNDQLTQHDFDAWYITFRNMVANLKSEGLR